MSQAKFEKETIQLMLDYISDHFIHEPLSPQWNYHPEGVFMMDSTIVKSAKLLVKSGMFVETENIMGPAIFLANSEALKPLQIDSVLSQFMDMGLFYGYFIDHPKEGFLVDMSVIQVFSNLLKLGYCRHDKTFHYWTDQALQYISWGGFHPDLEEPINWSKTPKTWRAIRRYPKPSYDAD